jgi:DNA/RNA endonuclease YhcR with UshA esterase domain
MKVTVKAGRGEEGMKMLFTKLATAGFGLLLGASAAQAHHSFSAEFDSNRPVQLSGKVTEMKWSNPHGWIYIDVENEDGTVTNWALETSAANALIRRGWRKADLPEGTVLNVEGWQARNGSATANIRSVELEDGRRLFAGTSNPTAQGEQ